MSTDGGKDTHTFLTAAFVPAPVWLLAFQILQIAEVTRCWLGF